MNTTLSRRASASLTVVLLAVGLSGCFIVDASRYQGLPDDASADSAVDDGGPIDAGPRDANLPDLGPLFDGGDVDAGDVDAGDVDAGDVDAGDLDAGDVDAGPTDGGVNCATGHGGCDLLVTCDDSVDGPVCGACPVGYHGDVVRGCLDDDECGAVPAPCGAVPGTVCTNTPGTYECSCPGGFEGMPTGGTCTNINECLLGTPCGPSTAGICADEPGWYTCVCAGGYAQVGGIGPCVDENECAGPRICDVLTSCTNLPGAFSCSACPAGYTGTGYTACVDVDECAAGTPCGAAAAGTCANTTGSFTCTCAPGYGHATATAACVDVNECTAGLADCDVDPVAGCANSAGTYGCACPVGFTGTGHGATGCRYTDPALASLTFGGATPSPAFNPATTAYTVNLGPASATFTLTPMVVQPGHTTITVDGVVTASGTTATVHAGYLLRDVEVVVTTDSGVARTYTFSVARGGPTYVKSSRTNSYEYFGVSIAMSADGTRMAIGKHGEGSGSTGVGGVEGSGTESNSGAVYVFRRTASGWTQEAFIKASNTGAGDRFGVAVSLSADGSRLAVGADNEDSASGADQADNTASNSGAAYVFSRSGTTWAQDAYVKATSPGADDAFGGAVSLSADGTYLAVGAATEDSNATGVAGDAANNSAPSSGAVYVFAFSAVGGVWNEQAYVKAFNTGAGDQFGSVVSLSADGAYLAVAARYEDSNEVDVGGIGSSDAAPDSGAAYVFSRAGTAWSQHAYVKASNTDPNDQFGASLALSSDGLRLVVGAINEGSPSRLIGGAETNGGDTNGAAYVFVRSGTFWTQEEYLKASNSDNRDRFGWAVAIAGDGSRVAVGAPYDASSATGIGIASANNDVGSAGAAYVFVRSASAWAEEAYVKATNPDVGDTFGVVLALSGDGVHLAVYAPGEASSATGINGNQANNGSTAAGAVYAY